MNYGYGYGEPQDYRSYIRSRLGIPQTPQTANPVAGQPYMPWNSGLMNKHGGIQAAYLPQDPRLGISMGLPIENPIHAPFDLPAPTPIGTPKSQIQPLPQQPPLPPDVSLPSPVPMGPNGAGKQSLYRRVFE